MSFHGVDFYELDDLLSEEERLVRDTVRPWVSEKVIPVIGRHYDQGRFPAHLISGMGELGVLGANLPQEYGCAGLSNVAYGLAMQELERGDSGVRSFASVQGSLCMYPLVRFGSEEQKRRWLPSMARGEQIGCFGLTEADGGSDPSTMRTRAVAEGDDFRLNGAKMWITNGTVADVALVWAKVAEQGREVVRGFLVEQGTPGFSAPEIKRKNSLRASVTSELVLDDVLVPRENMLPDAKGLKAPLSCLTQARFGIAWGALGAAMACYQEALDFTLGRITFGGPIAGKQLVQHKLAWMLGEITKHQLLCWRLGRLKDAGKLRHAQVSLAKRDCVQMALTTARLARDLLGASGITTEYQTIRHMCNLESVSTYEGTHDIHTLVLGHEITGLRAY